MCGLLKDRCDTTVALADWASRFYLPTSAARPTKRPSTSPTACARPSACWPRCSRAALGQGEAIAESIKEVLRATGLKMPQLAMPVRVLVLGTAQTPSLDAVLELLPRDVVVQRLAKA
jgi:glutamyl-tRNA synthetase